MHIRRLVALDIKKRLMLTKSKVVVIYGARQVGKTTLVKTLIRQWQHDDASLRVLQVDGDLIEHRDVLSSQSLQQLSELVSGYDLLFIDEAQRIVNIGIGLKILHDNCPTLKIVVTGSSSLDLASQVKEALTGRAYSYLLYPISMSELHQTNNVFELRNQLPQRMVFGSYPEVFGIDSDKEKQAYLMRLSQDYLYKDVLELLNIRYSHKLRDLLRLLAFQIGSEVSLSELGGKLELSKQTVARYIDLLEQSFVIFPLRGFSRNLRKEVSKKPKLYFYDLGIRNAILGNFNMPDKRNDVGVLWENFLIIERQKSNAYSERFASSYFWRTYTGAELDYVEEVSGELTGYEIKWKKKSKAPKSWLNTYQASFESITQANFQGFIL